MAVRYSTNPIHSARAETRTSALTTAARPPNDANSRPVIIPAPWSVMMR